MSNSGQSSNQVGISRIQVQALGLLIVIPYLGILYLFWDQLRDRWLPVLFLLVISGLGFYILSTILRAVSSIMKSLEKVSRGEAESLEIPNAPSQLREMTEIINALNKLTIEFRENASQLERFIEQFSMLTELTEITSRIPDINELLTLVLRKAMASTHARLSTVMLLGEDGKGLEVIAAEGWVPSRKCLIEPEETLCGKVVETGLPLLVEDIDADPDLGRHNDPSRYTSHSFLIMPLKAKSSTVGAVCLSEKMTGKSFTLQDQQFLTVMLGQIGFAVENARLLRHAREAAQQLSQTVRTKDIQLQDAHRQIIQSEKLSALGQMIAGVAHEINNPLTSVIGYAELLLRLEDQIKHEDARKNLQIVLEEATRAGKIVHNLLAFARERKPEPRMANLNDVVERVLKLREHDLKTYGVKLTMNLDSTLPQTSVDVDQIQQVILNLINNSVQSLPPEGVRQIEIGTKRISEAIDIWVSDTGRGIPAAAIDRIFDPFFTTKAEKTNTGLGLSISYGIIKQHGGNISVDSHEGEGTRITIRLPITTTATDEGKYPEPRPVATRDFAGRRALVVDDEERIANLVAHLLRTVGFEVTVFHSGQQALQNLLKEAYDLVICDVRIPDLDGRTLYSQFEAAHPDRAKRFLFMTGVGIDRASIEFIEERGLRLLSKPFSQQDLIEAASAVIARKE